MKIIFSIVGEQRGVKKCIFAEIIGIELAADHDQFGFGGEGDAGIRCSAGQSRGGEFVAVSAAVRAAITERMAVFLRQEGKGEMVRVLHDRVGEALRTDEADGDRLVPQNAATAPTRGHGVGMRSVGGGDQHPLLANAVKDRVEILRGDGLKVIHGCFLLSPVVAGLFYEKY